jgi:predicted HicB family RNase H-like nuclease
MVSDAQKKANQRYNQKTYDQIKVLVKKGQREEIKAHAEKQGKSLNAYITDLIKADMKK